MKKKEKKITNAFYESKDEEDQSLIQNIGILFY